MNVGEIVSAETPPTFRRTEGLRQLVVGVSKRPRDDIKLKILLLSVWCGVSGTDGRLRYQKDVTQFLASHFLCSVSERFGFFVMLSFFFSRLSQGRPRQYPIPHSKFSLLQPIGEKVGSNHEGSSISSPSFGAYVLLRAEHC